MPLVSLTPDKTLETLEQLKKARAKLSEHKRAVEKNSKDRTAQHLVETWQEEVERLEDLAAGL